MIQYLSLSPTADATNPFIDPVTKGVEPSSGGLGGEVIASIVISVLILFFTLLAVALKILHQCLRDNCPYEYPKLEKYAAWGAITCDQVVRGLKWLKKMICCESSRPPSPTRIELGTTHLLADYQETKIE